MAGDHPIPLRDILDLLSHLQANHEKRVVDITGHAIEIPEGPPGNCRFRDSENYGARDRDRRLANDFSPIDSVVALCTELPISTNSDVS